MRFLSVFALVLVAFGAGLSAACTGEVKVSNEEKMSGQQAERMAVDSQVVASGTLEGKSGHKMSGSVFLKRSGKDFVIEFGDDFDFDGAPAPVVGFGKAGYKPESKVGTLRLNKGRHAYRVPASVKAGEYNEIWVWCTDYDVPLGTAKLAAGRP